MNSWINLNALWKILVVGLLAGAGLPALFAVGLRSLSAGPDSATASPAGATASASTTANPLRIVMAIVCFAVVLAAIGWGIDSIVASS